MAGQYIITRTDGMTGTAVIPELKMGHILWEPDCGIRAGGRICHDGQNLYVYLAAREQNIRAEYTFPPAPVHEDSCLEFFFMPAGEERYLNFEINPNGCLHLGFGPDRQHRENVLPPDPRASFMIRTGRTKDGWEAEYRIPAAFLRQFYPAFECAGILRANLYKCGDKTIHPHYLAWNPVGTPMPDFHRPEYFGDMTFEQF